MEFLDSLDLETTSYKANRVRSWYLYEQYKSLEKNQLYAAQRLKDTFYQKSILQQELSQRKSRRRLYGRLDLSEKESRIETIRKKSFPSVSAEDFVSICEDDVTDMNHEANLKFSNYTMSEKENIDSTVFGEDDDTSHSNADSLKSIINNADSVKSIIDNVDNDHNVADEIKREIESEHKQSADSINHQLDTVKKNIDEIKELIEIDDSWTNVNNVNSLDKIEITKSDTNEKFENNEGSLLMLWTKLVSFAYQLMKVNHGNCYNDYSAQVMIAVLACDVFCRSLYKICNILQPYVCPVKFTTNENEFDEDFNNGISKKSVNIKQNKKIPPIQDETNALNIKKRCIGRHNRSENLWQLRPKYYGDRFRRCSEPWHTAPKMQKNEAKQCDSSTFTNKSSSLWPEEFLKSTSRVKCTCGCHRVENPMIELVRYIDNIMQAECEHYQRCRKFK